MREWGKGRENKWWRKSEVKDTGKRKVKKKKENCIKGRRKKNRLRNEGKE